MHYVLGVDNKAENFLRRVSDSCIHQAVSYDSVVVGKLEGRPRGVAGLAASTSPAQRINSATQFRVGVVVEDEHRLCVTRTQPARVSRQRHYVIHRHERQLLTGRSAQALQVVYYKV